ncbi:hypothetical protein L7F22_012520 [Adiantum nelumboides]|nr:hypothetical protein [Adiantum nelumboides]
MEDIRVQVGDRLQKLLQNTINAANADESSFSAVMGLFKELRVGLRGMLNQPHCSDLRLLCSDGVTLHAVRSLLIARSPFFTSMLKTETHLDSTTAVLRLPSVASTALLPALEFLYTGTISAPLDLPTAFSLLHAASTLAMADLQAPLHTAIFDTLLQSSATLQDSLIILAQILTHVISSSSALNLCDDIVWWLCISLGHHCCTESRPAAFLQLLSPQAAVVLLDCLIHQSSSFFLPGTTALLHYIWVRTLVLWNATRIDLQEEYPATAVAFLEDVFPSATSLEVHAQALTQSSSKSYLEVGLGRPPLLSHVEQAYLDKVLMFLTNQGQLDPSSRLSSPTLPSMDTISQKVAILHLTIRRSVIKPLGLVSTFFHDPPSNTDNSSSSFHCVFGHD